MILRRSVLALACCALAPTAFAADVPSAADAIRAANARLAELVLARQTDAVFDVFYAEDAVLYPPNSGPVSGVEAIKTLWRGLAASGKVTMALTFDEVQQHGDTALEIGHWTLDVVPASGGAAVHDHGRYVVVWKRQPSGAWRATHDIWNSSQAPPQP